MDYRNADLSGAQRGLCDYAIDLTVAAYKSNESRLQNLREIGLSDRQISLATQIIGYFNYINRVANGLGVDPEPWMTFGREEWLEQKTNFRVEWKGSE